MSLPLVVVESPWPGDHGPLVPGLAVGTVELRGLPTTAPHAQPLGMELGIRLPELLVSKEAAVLGYPQAELKGQIRGALCT